jgi:hypothetical protein
MKNTNFEKTKFPVKFLETLDGGTAHVILFSDDKKYVVKWNATSNKRAKEVVNEYVAGNLATLLSLPVVPFELVYIPADFISNTPKLKSKKHTFNPGCHYACLFIENSIELSELNKSLPSKTDVINHEMLAAMVVFDHWVHNIDRTMSNLLLEKRNNEVFYVHLIDHGKCFPGGYNWSVNTLRTKSNDGLPFRETYHWVFSILNEEDFTQFVEKIINLPNERIFEVIRSIPEEWQVSKEESEALFQYLVKQKNQLPDLVANFIEQYKNNLINKKKEKKLKKKKKK